MDDSNDVLLELLAREGGSLHVLLTRLTLDEHAAEDLMQELFLNADRSSGLRTARNPAAYLRQMAIHLWVAWRRGRHERSAPASAAEVADPSPGAEAATMEREQWQRILDCAVTLSGLARDVFVLRFVEGQDADEIAEQIGKTPHQVRALASKAVAEVRQLVKAQEEKEDSHVRR